MLSYRDLLVIENNLEITSDVIYLFMGRLFFILAITIPFDIRDLKYDEANLRTIPIIFGASKARLIGLLFLLVFEMISIIQFYFHQNPLKSYHLDMRDKFQLNDLFENLIDS